MSVEIGVVFVCALEFPCGWQWTEAHLMFIIDGNLNKTTMNKIVRYVCFHR